MRDNYQVDRPTNVIDVCPVTSCLSLLRILLATEATTVAATAIPIMIPHPSTLTAFSTQFNFDAERTNDFPSDTFHASSVQAKSIIYFISSFAFWVEPHRSNSLQVLFSEWPRTIETNGYLLYFRAMHHAIPSDTEYLLHFGWIRNVFATCQNARRFIYFACINVNAASDSIFHRIHVGSPSTTWDIATREKWATGIDYENEISSRCQALSLPLPPH